MTNKQIAQNLRDAEMRGDTDDIIMYENEIIGRLNLPLNDTEQGLTPAAADAVEDFCKVALA